MLKEAIEKILSLAPPTRVEDGARSYSDRSLLPIQAPLLGAVDVCTLAGFVDLISNGVDNFPAEVFVHVVDHVKVRLIGKISDTWGRRVTYAESEVTQTQGFKFGQYLGHEEFLIGIGACFTSGGDRDYLLKLASNISTERVGTSSDDGISQQVGVKAGVVLKSTETVRARVTLAPYRTFREVDQPLSEFLVRVKQGAEGLVPSLALFEADGGAWKITAIENIARYLRPNVKGISVIS